MERLRGFSELREDLTRLASYHSARKRGMSADEAAEHVSAHHFDYGDLTETERAVFRRFIPFYTFMARNTRLQATGVLTQPGCFATTEKARQESGRAGGFDPDWAKALRKFEQQGVPFATPVEVGGFPVTVYPKLPLMDLNNLTTSPQTLGENILGRSTALGKTLLEQATGFNTFTREKYSKDRVPAPAPLGDPLLRDAVNGFSEETMGVTNAVKDIRAPRTGEMVPGWSWRIEQLARNVPWLNFVLTATVPTKHQRPNDTALATAGFIAGPRPVQFDVQAVQLNQKWEERDQLQAEVDELKQTVPGHKRGDTWGGKVGRLNARIADIDRDIYKLGKAMGHEDPAGRPPRKGRKRTARYFGAAPAPQAPVEQAAVLRREPVTSVRSPAQDEG